MRDLVLLSSASSRLGERKNIQFQRGISLVVVIFLLAVVSVLTLSMMNLSGTQHMSSLYTARGAQAYFAARSGIEYAVAQLVAGGGCANQTISGFAVTITCPAVGAYNEGNAAAPYTVYRVTATATSGTFQVPDVANRQLTVTVKVP
jgi:MSHA biogenesis protein MshP